MDAKDFINDIQIGMTGLQEYEVQVKIPSDFTFSGAVPFDMHFVNGVAFVTVPAKSLAEAVELATEYFNG